MLGLIEKLLALISVGTALTNISVLHRFLAGVATVIALTIVSSVMAGLLIVAAFYGIDRALMHFGVEPDVALSIVVALAAAVTGTLAWMTMQKIRKLQNFAALHKASEQPTVQKLHGVLNAFLNGLTKPYNAPENTTPVRRAG